VPQTYWVAITFDIVGVLGELSCVLLNKSKGRSMNLGGWAGPHEACWLSQTPGNVAGAQQYSWPAGRDGELQAGER
jgi:hypothetical protein